MRVGLLIYGDLDTLTGGYLYDRKLVAYLKERGDSVEIISLKWRYYGRHLLDNLSRTLLHRLAKAKLDVLIQDELNHPSLFAVNRWLKRRVDYRLITLVHLLRSSELRRAMARPLYRAVERRYFKSVDGAIFNSQTTREAVEQLTGRRIPGVVAYPGRDHLRHQTALAEVAARAAMGGPLRIAFVGNVLAGKGLDTLIEAMRRLPRGTCRLMAIGSLTMDAAYAERIRRQVASAGLTDHIELLGAVPNEEVPGYLNRNHVLAVPSRYEALGIAYLEAMGCGLPVIATTAGGAHEIVRHGEVGFLTKPGDEEMLAGYLRELDQDRGRLVEMSLAAHQRVAAHPTWDESFAVARDFLQSCLMKGGNPCWRTGNVDYA
jgi:glycosyltransferase involved in cell wall biosynthesis